MGKKDAATTTVSLGMRISGLRSYQPKKSEYVVKDKSWGKKVKDNTMAESIAVFFNDGVNIRKNVVKAFLPILKKIQEYFESQHDLRFFSSSLLFLFEGSDAESLKVDIRMIDFAHVHQIHDGGTDGGYVVGMKNLMKIFEDLAK